MFDLKELDRWKTVTTLKFSGDDPRKVRLEVLAESEAKLFVDLGPAGRHFIGVFEGYDVVQFNVPGLWSLTAKGGPVKVWTPEMDRVSVEASPDAVNFVRIMQRRARNPELEKMMYAVQMNMERRLQQVQSDVTLKVAEQRRRDLADLREAAVAARQEEEAVAGDNGDAGAGDAGA